MNLETELLECGMTERGNTSLRHVETGSVVFYKSLNTNSWLEITYMVDNYPAWNISIVTKTLAEIRTHIEENFSELWVVERNNIGINTDYGMPVSLEYTTAEILDVLKTCDPIAPVDVVENIHNILKDRQWSMDITDIEALTQTYNKLVK